MTRGRPKLGVISREVTLQPRHWAWLADQQRSASATLRHLIDRASTDPDFQLPEIGTSVGARRAQDLTHQFARAIAGDCPGYDAALRALYARDEAAFRNHTLDWPCAIRTHALELAAPVWPDNA